MERLSALLADRGILYVGGTFDHVGPRTGPGVPLDISTASPMTGFPRVEGSYPFTPFVYAAVSDGKGGWFIGGTFITVGGQGRQKLAHIASDDERHVVEPRLQRNGVLARAGREHALRGRSVHEPGGRRAIASERWTP